MKMQHCVEASAPVACSIDQCHRLALGTSWRVIGQRRRSAPEIHPLVHGRSVGEKSTLASIIFPVLPHKATALPRLVDHRPGPRCLINTGAPHGTSLWKRSVTRTGYLTSHVQSHPSLQVHLTLSLSLSRSVASVIKDAAVGCLGSSHSSSVTGRR